MLGDMLVITGSSLTLKGHGSNKFPFSTKKLSYNVARYKGFLYMALTLSKLNITSYLSGMYTKGRQNGPEMAVNELH